MRSLQGPVQHDGAARGEPSAELDVFDRRVGVASGVEPSRVGEGGTANRADPGPERRDLALGALVNRVMEEVAERGHVTVRGDRRVVRAKERHEVGVGGEGLAHRVEDTGVDEDVGVDEDDELTGRPGDALVACCGRPRAWCLLDDDDLVGSGRLDGCKAGGKRRRPIRRGDDDRQVGHGLSRWLRRARARAAARPEAGTSRPRRPCGMARSRVTPRARNQSQTRFTSRSGAEAPEVTPTVVTPSSQRLVDLRLVVDQVGRHPAGARDVDQPVRVRGVPRADHEQQVDLGEHLLDRPLPVGGRVADVFLLRPADAGKRRRRTPMISRGLVDRERRLRDVGDASRPRAGRAPPPRRRPGRAPSPPVPRPSSRRPPRGRRARSGSPCSPSCGVPPRLDVHLRHQRARGVDHVVAEPARVRVHAGATPCAE